MWCSMAAAAATIQMYEQNQLGLCHSADEDLRHKPVWVPGIAQSMPSRPWSRHISAGFSGERRTTSSSLEWVLEKRPALGRLSYVVQCSTAYARRSSSTCNNHASVLLRSLHEQMFYSKGCARTLEAASGAAAWL